MRLQQVANACPFFRVAEGKDRNGCEKNRKEGGKIGRRAKKVGAAETAPKWKNSDEN